MTGTERQKTWENGLAELHPGSGLRSASTRVERVLLAYVFLPCHLGVVPQVLYPQHMFLVRGNHESKNMNKVRGCGGVMAAAAAGEVRVADVQARTRA